MLAQVHVDELRQRRRFYETALAAQTIKRPRKRLHRSLLGREAATPHTPRVTTTDPIPAVCPTHLTTARAERDASINDYKIDERERRIHVEH